MSARTFQIGFQIGTVMRECIRAISSQSKPIAITLSATASKPFAPPPAPTSVQFESLCRSPAFVRNKGVDLNAWFAANVRESQPSPKKPRARKPKQNHSEALPVAVPTEKNHGPTFGSLNELIA
ncbi:hypothetical protein ACIQAL_22165 [Pseudomonas sp. NPDC088368]|uniref:hypothetical protein n=1 Tax=Pseudomonas sp. NPDC088368 TaxID=3364453 RepID=UPI0037F62255